MGPFDEQGSHLTNTNINIPVLIKYKFFKNIPINLGIGPYIGLLISMKEKGTRHLDTTQLHPIEPSYFGKSFNLLYNYNEV